MPKTYTLKEAREKAGFATQAELAKAATVNQSQVSRAEAGHKPTRGTLVLLALAVGLKPEQLRFGIILLALALLVSACGDSPAAPSTGRRAVRPVPVVRPVGDGQ